MNDLSKRLADLSPEKRAALEKLVKKGFQVKTNPVETTEVDAVFDVVILGGGLAGLTLALQIVMARPETQILIVEKHKHPVPEAAFKVGESTVEVGANYFGEVLNLKDNFKKEQLPKFGLRYFFNAGDNHDMTERVELGATFFPPTPSYQLDRGRLENTLSQKVQEMGVTLWDGCQVKEVILNKTHHHTVGVQIIEGERVVGARWVIDASGRSSLLKRQLGLQREIGHKANAAWFRIADELDIGTWSDDPEWRSHVPSQYSRRLSTNHLMGDGYWVWLIPLASGATSVGIVTDATIFPASETNRPEKALAWLRKYEPVCAQHIEEKLDLMLDFRALRDFAYGCRRVFSSERWCLTGEAGVFIDPFYSPGSDFIALGNTFISDLVVRDLEGEEIYERLEQYNQFYLNTFEAFIPAYEGQYTFMGNAQVMVVKVAWDFAIYWAFIGMVFFHRKYCDLEFMASMADIADRFARLSSRVQQFFREWSRLGKGTWSPTYVDGLSVSFLYQLNCDLTTPFSDDELRAKIRNNLRFCENLAAAMFKRVAQLMPGGLPKGSVNPYAITLDRERWETDGVFETAEQREIPAEILADLDKLWVDASVTAEVDSMSIDQKELEMMP